MPNQKLIAPSSSPAFWTVREKFVDPISAFIFGRWNWQARVEEFSLVAKNSNLNLRVACEVVRSLGTCERWQNTPNHANLRAFTVSENWFWI